MTKQMFTEALRAKLMGLPDKIVEEQIAFLCETIDDRIEEGMSEEDAVCAVGSVEEVANRILTETPLTKIVAEKIKPKRRLRWWEITFISVGSPLWLALAVVLFAVVLTIYAVAWSVVAVLWSAFGALAGGAFGGIVAGVTVLCRSFVATGIALMGAGICCAGLSIFLFFGCLETTKGMAYLSKKIFLGIGCLFVGKERAK